MPELRDEETFRFWSGFRHSRPYAGFHLHAFVIFTPSPHFKIVIIPASQDWTSSEPPGCLQLYYQQAQPLSSILVFSFPILLVIFQTFKIFTRSPGKWTRESSEARDGLGREVIRPSREVNPIVRLGGIPAGPESNSWFWNSVQLCIPPLPLSLLVLALIHTSQQNFEAGANEVSRPWNNLKLLLLPIRDFGENFVYWYKNLGEGEKVE